MDYQSPIILSGYELPVEGEYQPSTLDEPTLSVGYTLEEKPTVGANLPLTQLFNNGDLNISALFIFEEERVDYSAGLTVDILDSGSIEVSSGLGVAYIDETLKPSVILNGSLDMAASHRLEVNSFFDWDNVYTSVGYGYTF